MTRNTDWLNLPTEKEKSHTGFFSCLVALAIIATDQITKLLAKTYISQPIEISSFFNLVLVMNAGAAWGIMAGKSFFLLTISAVVLLLILLFHEKITEGWNERYYALALIAGGIVGNTIDRVWWKAVIDFLDFHLAGYHWPAFNIADSAICIGVGIFVISSLLRPQKRKNNAYFF